MCVSAKFGALGKLLGEGKVFQSDTEESNAKAANEYFLNLRT